jgi:phosphoserine phosphatase RsbU/P
MTTLATIGSYVPGHLGDFEHEEARQIQQSLLPSGSLNTSFVEIAYRFAPYSGVGGDFADFFLLPNGNAALYIGDVVGKGLSAAMYATLVMGTLRGTHKTGTDTGAVLATLNHRLLMRPVAGRYAATLYAVYDSHTHQLSFSNAGLPHPLLSSGGHCGALGQGGLPSGLLKNSAYESHHLKLSPGDTVLFATDGLTELRDRHDNDFGWDRLSEIWKHCRFKSADEALDFVFSEASQFSDGGQAKHDDITAVVLKVPYES